VFDSLLADSVGIQADQLSALIASLTARKITVACAESLTGGLLSAVLTEVPGASAVLRGAVVVYATDLKNSLAGVDAALLRARGPVDPEVAVALAMGARTACTSVLGVGLTGVAGPDSQNGVAVDTWYVAITDGSRHQLISHLPATGQGTRASRSEIRAAAVRAAVHLLGQFGCISPSV